LAGAEAGRDAGDFGIHGAGAGSDWGFVPVLLLEGFAGDWGNDFGRRKGVPVFAEVGGAVFPAGGVCGSDARGGVREGAVCVDDAGDGGAASWGETRVSI